MEAPDKIYVPLTINLLTKRQVLRLDATDVKPISFANENIEYIRKEALLEWAKETYLSENASQIRKVCFKQLIDKINSM